MFLTFIIVPELTDIVGQFLYMLNSIFLLVGKQFYTVCLAQPRACLSIFDAIAFRNQTASTNSENQTKKWG